MQRILNNLAFVLPLLVLVSVAVYAIWIRELPKAEGHITGDYAAAAELAAAGGIPLFVAVDTAPS
ncbi:MAG: hypothetical protein KDB90_10135 [Planctomycetes bacterium]|nr:hypothetical protein [Planctomycetota bacterium]